MDKYELLIGDISKQTRATFRPASRASLAQLRGLNVPENIIRFYERFEPAKRTGGPVHLLPIAEIVMENTRAVPGIGVQPYGYAVFASTGSGDAYCFNSNKVDAEGEPEIVLVSHEVVGEDAIEEDVLRLAKPVAVSLRDFLEQFYKGEIDEQCIY